MLKVLALTSGVHISSSRYRVAQYRERLRAAGIDLIVKPGWVETYPPPEHWRRPAWLAGTVAAQVPRVLASLKADLTLLQREMISTLPSFEGLTRRPRVVDVDDAIWLRRGGLAARHLARVADRIICGNDFLADYFSKLCGDVHVLPTAVDTDLYRPAPPRPASGRVRIGWSGSVSGVPYLYDIEPALERVLRARPQVVLKIVSNSPPRFMRLPASQVEFVRWTAERDVAEFQDMDIGIMPLRDTDWERGKCSYKMLLYMSCGLPAVVSPVGMNLEVLAAGRAGYPARSQAEWADALIALVDSPAERAALGAAGREVVERRYSTALLAPRLAGILRGAAREPRSA